VGAIAMCLLIRIPLEKIKLPLKTVVCTFLSTLVSGFSFIGVMYFLYYARPNMLIAPPTPLAIFMAIIFGTAAINAVIVQVLYIPLKLVLKKE
jgi:hypothetical protein